jgi:hypothetical protein
MAKTRRVISDEQLAKMQAGAKAARAAKVREGQKCGDCGRKVKPSGHPSEPYVRSTTRKGVVYCWPNTGCWITPTGKSRTREEIGQAANT